MQKCEDLTSFIRYGPSGRAAFIAARISYRTLSCPGSHSNLAPFQTIHNGQALFPPAEYFATNPKTLSSLLFSPLSPLSMRCNNFVGDIPARARILHLQNFIIVVGPDTSWGLSPILWSSCIQPKSLTYLRLLPYLVLLT